jgi:hypothetical protein
LVSGDWPGAASRFVERRFGDKIIAPVTAGASGDINPVYGPHLDFKSGYNFAVDAIGNILSEEVMRVGKDIKTSFRGDVSTLQKNITFPGKDVNGKPGPSLDVRISLLKVGDIVLIGISGEVFNEIGMKIKKQSHYNYTFIIIHCNGSSGYIVTDKSYKEGGYEPNYSKAKIGAE